MDLRDFESFKQNFEVFTKIDTPEKLEICQKQHERYLLDLECANYFEPETENKLSEIFLKYDTLLRKLLESERIREKEFYLLIKPAFEPESLVIFSGNEQAYSICVKELDSNYWDKIYSNEAEIPDLIIYQ